MNSIYRFEWHRRGATNAPLEQRLLAIVPEFASPMNWSVFELQCDDPRVADVINSFQNAGLPFCKYISNNEANKLTAGYISMWRRRRYFEFDRSSAEWLWVASLDPDRRVVGLGRTAGAELVLGRSDTPNDFDVLGGLMTLLVRAAVRDELESMRLIGLGFKPVHFGKHEFDSDPVYGKRRRTVVLPPEPDEDWSEIWPSIELPQMHAPEIRRLDTTTRAEFNSPDRGPAVFVNPGFDDGQPVYTRESLRSVGPFDFARTWEYCYPQHESLRWTIISQRFYRFLLDRGVEGTFIPVKIVDA